MKKKKIWLLSAALAVAVLTACNVTKDIENAYNLKDCKYSYKSISNIRVNNEPFSVLSAAKLFGQLGNTQSKMPIEFTLNLNVENPNASAAAFQTMAYKRC